MRGLTHVLLAQIQKDRKEEKKKGRKVVINVKKLSGKSMIKEEIKDKVKS